MIIHIISTVNGLQNEGMRNVATHFGNCFSKNNNVHYTSLKAIHKILYNCCRSDVTMIFARCNSKVYAIARLAELFCRNIWIVLVQKPQHSFIQKNNARPLKCNYLTICDKDASKLRLCPNGHVYSFNAGINTEKFKPVTNEKAKELKKKYGFDENMPLVIHVGHCSYGRGLEDFLYLNADLYNRLIVSSGMFEDKHTLDILKKSGIHVFSEYMDNVNEIYQMADAYLFPTKSDEFVISTPLSVMEALACGTPVIAYRSFHKLSSININNNEAITFVDSADMLADAVKSAVQHKSVTSYLSNAESWDEISKQIFVLLKENLI